MVHRITVASEELQRASSIAVVEFVATAKCVGAPVLRITRFMVSMTDSKKAPLLLVREEPQRGLWGVYITHNQEDWAIGLLDLEGHHRLSWGNIDVTYSE